MECWSRDVVEAASIRAQAKVYSRLDAIRDLVPDDSGLDAVEPFLAPLVTMTAFDLGQDRLSGFGAVSLPLRTAARGGSQAVVAGRVLRGGGAAAPAPGEAPVFLQSISEAAATAPGWSNREPCFYPEWVDKIEQRLPN
jgi:hypothetical protein